MDVVIVSHGTRNLTRECVRSVVQEGAERTIVVDNGSMDGTPSILRTEFPDVLLIENKHNPGYGTAANQALRLCESEFVLVLNSDTELKPGALNALAVCLNANPRAAIVAPRLLSLDGQFQRSCRRFPGSAVWLADNLVFASLLARIPGLQRWPLCVWAHDSHRIVPWTMGAALACRRNAVMGIGGFDEDFFFYLEDVDLCKRLRNRGWETHFTPSATVMHGGGASISAYGNTRGAALLKQATKLFYRKHYGPVRVALLSLVEHLKPSTAFQTPSTETSVR